jgi:hypothetical protein
MVLIKIKNCESITENNLSVYLQKLKEYGSM